MPFWVLPPLSRWRCILTKREASSSASIVARTLPRGRRLGETAAPQCRTCTSEEQRYSGELRGDTFPGQRLKTTEHPIVVQPGQSSRNKRVRFADLQEDGGTRWRSGEIWENIPLEFST